MRDRGRCPHAGGPVSIELGRKVRRFFYIVGGDADAIVLDLDAYRFVRLRSSRDDDPAAVDLSLYLTVVMLADGENFGPLEYDIGVAQLDMAGFFLTPGDDPICAPDDGGSAHCSRAFSQSTILLYSALPPGPNRRARRNPWIMFSAQ
jgi:hypothetical protein